MPASELLRRNGEENEQRAEDDDYHQADQGERGEGEQDHAGFSSASSISEKGTRYVRHGVRQTFHL
jgi:hypothetical protein